MLQSPLTPEIQAEVDRDLAPIRVEIDTVDAQLLRLLNERAKLAQRVGEVKQKYAQPVYRPERESVILEKIAAQNPGPLPTATLQTLWREVMSACRAMEEPVKVAYLGPAGTYTEQAMFKQFGHAIVGVDCVSIDDIFHAVEAGGATFGVVPIENSIEGAINRTMDLLLIRLCACALRCRWLSSIHCCTARAIWMGSQPSSPIRKRSRSAMRGSNNITRM